MLPVLLVSAASKLILSLRSTCARRETPCVGGAAFADAAADWRTLGGAKDGELAEVAGGDAFATLLLINAGER